MIQTFWKPYQVAFLQDQAPRVCVLKSRRVGFSEAVAAKCALRLLGLALRSGRVVQARKRGITQNLFSASRVQAQDLLQRVLKWVRVFGSVFGGNPVDRETATLAVVRGVKIRALSSSPRGARGWEGDIVLDEFASVVDQQAIWAAVEPLAAPTHGNPDGFLITAISTPLGNDNLYHEMVTGKLAHKFSQHCITLADAHAQGFPIKVSDGIGGLRDGTVEELRAEYGDDQTFDQEFMCSFLSSSMRFIDAESYDAASYADDEFPSGALARDFGGLDLARVRDRTAFARLSEVGDVLWHAATDAIQGVRWSDQERWWDERIERCGKVAVDSTSIGSAPAERMQETWGMSRIVAVDFTLQSKERLATGLKLAIQSRRLRPLRDDSDTRREVLSMRREQLPGGGVRYSVPRTASGHGDRAWALALAVSAAGDGAITVPHITARSRENRRSAPYIYTRRRNARVYG